MDARSNSAVGGSERSGHCKSLQTVAECPLSAIAALAGIARMVATANATEIKVICSGAMRPALEELAPQFERASGHKLAISFAGTNVIRDRVQAGEAVDVIILAAPALDELIKQGKLAAKVDLVRSGVGVGVRAGSPRPDLSSAETFKRALLAAKSFSRSEGPSGVYIAGLIERMGIAEQMKAKTVVVRGRLVGDALVKGEADLGVQQVSELKSVPGVDVFPMPAEIAHITVFSAGLSAAAKASAAATSLIEFLTSPAAAPVIKAKGLDPA
jgi:molybdate transport system substrate-binding protein